ncbi:MAG: DUF4091 domain-containing protein [Armatimonadetes bacterium]|nr:DUF4091 domain-containing protein [Armatimonadota bacterium]
MLSRGLFLLAVWQITASFTTAFSSDNSEFPKPEQRVLNVNWADVPPKVDGNMDDACWKEAEVAKDFALFKFAGWATQRTEVRVSYDAENLYVFWRLHEAKMDKLVVGGAEDARDFVEWEDVGELFLDPGRTEKDYYHFVATPLGARYDDSTRHGGRGNFTPDWECASGRFDGGWTLEEAIPFGELAAVGQMMATPQVGDRWGIQFCRDQGNLHEWSQWVPTNMGFHEPKSFGNAIFRGRRSGEPLPSVRKADPGHLFYGPDALSFTVEGATSVEGKCTVARDGKQIEEGQVKLQQRDGVAHFPYHLLDAGSFRFRLELTSGGKSFYSGQAAAFLPPTRETLVTMEKEIREGQRTLARLGNRHPAFVGLRQRVDEFDERSAAARHQVAKARDLTADEWRALVDQSDTLIAEWSKLQRDLNLAALYRGKAGTPPQLFAVGNATESDKVYRDTLYRGSLTEPIRLSLAGNEYGSFQLVMLPFWRDLSDVTVSFSPLRGPKGRVVPQENCRWFRISYVKLEGVNPKDLSAHAYEPDPLMPAEPFTVPPGEVSAVWVDVLLPEGTPVGTYRGRVTVASGGQSVSRDVEVKSYGFDIPKKSSLENDFWFGLYQWNWFYKPLNYTPELHAKHAEVLGRYRISSIPNDWITLCPQVPIYVEPDGRFTFDWATLDKYIQNGLKNGTSAFWSALSCNSGWTAWMNNPNVQVTERATGKKVPLGNYITGKSQYENPAYRDFLIAYVQHLKDLGVNDISYYELFDEPNDNSRWLQMIEHHQFFRKVVPDLHLLCYGVDPTQVKAEKSAIALIDAWAPHLTYVEGPIDKAIKERRAKYGEKYWGYTCGEGTDKDGNYSPYCLYNRPYISVRMNLWFAWHYQMDGFLIFAMSGVPDQNLKAKPEERWPNSDWSDGNYRGCGTFVYPGPNYELIPGMRLANAREGLEDYEYFAVLRNGAKRLDPIRDAKLLAKAEAALKVDKDILSTVYVWTKDRNRLEAKRGELAALIRICRRRDSAKSMSAPAR